MILDNAEFCMAGIARHYHVDPAGMPISRMVSLWRQLPAINAAAADKWAEYEVKRGAALYQRDPIYSVFVPLKNRKKPQAVN
jgi:hypothetical protein